MSIFEKVPFTRPKKSAINLSHERKFSCNMGELVPIFNQEVVPGDNFKIRLEQLVRFQALKSPMMHRVDVQTHFFFVPYRLIWSEWEKFITGGEDGTESPIFPRTSVKSADLPNLPVGGLYDHLGVPVQRLHEMGTFEPIEVSDLPVRAYALIFNEYFRDQNVVPKVVFSTGSGVNSGVIALQNEGKLLKRSWEKDYFTSALPWAQRGPSSLIPIANAPDIYAEKTNGTRVPVAVGGGAAGSQTIQAYDGTQLQSGKKLFTDSPSTTINELRRAQQLQRWLEKNARGGARYVEQILSHFGVMSDDARLQRPEYIGGGKTPVMLSEVLQQSQTTDTSPQGNMAGHGVSAGSSPYFQKYVKEHGLIIGLLSVMPKPAYMQGLPKIFTKFDKFDYFFPDFQHLGEQPIKNEELYLSSSANKNEATFGYTPRYAEYRYIPNTVHGDMRTSLKFWHMANDYSDTPNLNKAFIESSPTHRVFAVEDPSYQKLIVQTYADVKAIRPMSKYSMPY